MEFQVLESSQEMSSLKQQLEASQSKIKELEAKLSSLEERHLAHSDEANQGKEEQLERIKQLENDINNKNTKCKELDLQVQNSVSNSLYFIFLTNKLNVILVMACSCVCILVQL